MTPEEANQADASPRLRLSHSRRHTSPRIGRTPFRLRVRHAHRRLHADHRHVLPSRSGPGTTGEQGFSTAELLGNAALGIAALIAIWVVLEALGVSVVAWIGAQIGVG